MADLGIARVTNDADAANTLTRADLADVVHRRLGLSRAESAGVVERVLHHMCHALSEGKNVKVSGFGTVILRDSDWPTPPTGTFVLVRKTNTSRRG